MRLSVSIQPQGIGEPSVYHAVVVIFLEFFAWGLLTTPMLTVSLDTMPFNIEALLCKLT